MDLNILGRPSRLLALAVAGAALMTGCGGDGDEKTAGSTSLVAAPSTQLATTTSAEAESTTTESATIESTNTRSVISTTSTAKPADKEVTRAAIPESTNSYELVPASINGVSYANALRMSSYSLPGKLEISASRRQKRFLGTLGIPDDQLSTSSHLVEISLDNAAPILSVVVNFGESKPIDLDVTNVLRVRITVSSKTSTTGTVAIGDPRFE